jgi:S1-C subfamily serine protease
LPEGVVLLDLHPDSPLARVGLTRGDIILTVDSAPVNSAPEMMFRLAARGLGGQSDLTYRRGAQTATATIALDLPPNTPDRQTRQIDGASPLRGLEVMRINPAVIAELDLPTDAVGIVVSDLRDFAARTGLRFGDVILSINGQPIASTDDVLRAASDPTRNWQLQVLRDGARVGLRFRL